MDYYLKKLRFGGREFKPDIRFLSDMMGVIYDKEWLLSIKDPGTMPMYFMYRNLFRDTDLEIIKEKNIRYDITVIPPRKLGCEYVKTAGHFHPRVPGTDTSFMEIYEVLEGEAHYLLQKNEGGRVMDVILYKATERDKIIIPPGYGHITINPGNRELKMANWVSDRFSSEYGEIKKMGGGAYLELVDKGFIVNENYRGVPELRILDVPELGDLGIERDEDMYSLIRESPESLQFLNKPQEYRDILDCIIPSLTPLLAKK